MDINKKVAETIIERLELEGYTPDTLPKNAFLFAATGDGGLGFDSIASLEIIAALSDVFDLPFDDVQRNDLATVDSISAYIVTKLPGAK